MAFEKEGVKTPVALRDLSVNLFKPDPDSPEGRAATFSVQVVMSDGSVVVRSGDLGPHLSPQRITALTAFMDALYEQAQAEILPTEPAEPIE